MEEIWKPIAGYENYYEVSNYGRVRSLDRVIRKSNGVLQPKKGKIMPQRQNADGYAIVKLSKDAKSEVARVHKLVAETFLGKQHGLEIHHKDFNRTNNRADNLEYCSHQENIARSSLCGRYKERPLFGKDNPNYGNHILAERYKDHDLAVRVLGRPREQNGHCQKIEMYNSEMTFIEAFDWIGGCCEYLINNNIVKSKDINGLRDRISKASKENKIFHGFYFKKI